MKRLGRPPKYKTDAERKEAARIQARDCKRRRMELVRAMREVRDLCKRPLCLMQPQMGGFCRHHAGEGSTHLPEGSNHLVGGSHHLVKGDA